MAAVANGTDKIDVSWTASTDNVAVAGYHVFRDGNATAIATVTTGTNYQDPGLAPGSTHSYTVSAFDAVPNESAKSSPPASATTANDTTAPTVPTRVAAVANGTDKIDVSWTASTDNVAVAGYHVFRDGNATAIATVTTGTNYQDPGLAPGSTHSYTVSAFDAVPNESAKSSPPASATTGSPPDTQRRACRGCAAVANGTDKIDVSWTASTDNVAVAGYHVFRDGNATAIATVTTGTTTRIPVCARLDALVHGERVRRGPERIREIVTARLGHDQQQHDDDVHTCRRLLRRLVDSRRATSAPTPSSASTPHPTVRTLPQVHAQRTHRDGDQRDAARVRKHRPERRLRRVRGLRHKLDRERRRRNHLQQRARAGSNQNRLLRPRQRRNLDNRQRHPARRGNGTISIALTTTSSTALSMQSRTGANPPQLVVTATSPNDTVAPSVPSGVQAAANGTDKIDVSWTASTDNIAVAGYHVFRDGNATAIATVTRGTNYQDPGLAPARRTPTR